MALDGNPLRHVMLPALPGQMSVFLIGGRHHFNDTRKALESFWHIATQIHQHVVVRRAVQPLQQHNGREGHNAGPIAFDGVGKENRWARHSRAWATRP